MLKRLMIGIWFHFLVGGYLSLARGYTELSNAQQEFLKQFSSIKLCVGHDIMPLDDIRDVQHVGLNAAFMHQFSERLGLAIELVFTRDWSDSTASVRAGRCDIISLITETRQQDKVI